MEERNLIPPYVKSYKEFNFDTGTWNFVIEMAVNDYGTYVAYDYDNLDEIGMIFMLKTLADELGRQLESDG